MTQEGMTGGLHANKPQKHVAFQRLFFHPCPLISGRFVSLDSGHFKLRLTQESLYFLKNTDKKRSNYKNVNIYKKLHGLYKNGL